MTPSGVPRVGKPRPRTPAGSTRSDRPAGSFSKRWRPVVPNARVVFTEEDYRAAIEARARKTLGHPIAPLPTGNGKPSDRPPLTHIRDLLAEPDDAVVWIV